MSVRDEVRRALRLGFCSVVAIAAEAGVEPDRAIEELRRMPDAECRDGRWVLPAVEMAVSASRPRTTSRRR